MTNGSGLQKKVKFKPIHAIAEKIDTVEGKDILRIEVPYEDEINVLKQSNTESDKREGDIDMDEKELESKLESKFDTLYVKKMREDKIRENIDTIKNRTERLDEKFDSKLNENLDKIVSLDEKVSNLSDNIIEYNKVQEKKQEEACTGVECIKSTVSNLQRDSESKFEELKKNLEDIVKSKTKTVLCKGKEGCNANIPYGSTYCPNCGRHIDKWQSIPDWTPYDKRKG